MRHILFVLCFFALQLSAPENPRNWQEEILHTRILQKKKEREILVKNILTVIRQIESSGDYHARGASGEYGAYQFTLSTWRYYSEMFTGKILIMTSENQDLIAKKKIEMLLNQGLYPSEIASFWNSGKTDWKGVVGVNKFGVHYNTPSYVQMFNQKLKKL